MALKPLTRALARLLATDAGGRAALQAKLAAARGSEILEGMNILHPPAAEATPAYGPTRRVGIWEARDGAGGREFVRVPGPSWRRYADVERIGPKRGRRIVLLGESVARGYLYDPEHNVAKALQRALRALPELGPTEVVDLAVTSVEQAALLKRAQESLALEPDALVFLAGNNWWPRHAIDRSTTLRIARDLRGGFHRVRGLLEQWLAKHVSDFTQRVQELGGERRIPVLVVIPEFNLLDWRDDASREVPWLAEGKTMRWLEARERAEAALAASDFARASEAAAQMMELDDGVSSVSPTLLGHAKVGLGDTGEARRLFEVARDAEMWAMVPQTPRCFGITQRTLREQAALRGIPFIDLPRVFSDHLGGAIPDRSLFLDYCHMTATGIAITVRATALRLAELFGVSKPSSTLADVDLMPSRRVLAEAHFGAAIHNHVWAQPYDVVQWHCAQALLASPDVAESMAQFLDFRVRQIPTILSASFAKLRGGSGRGTAHYLTTHWSAPKTFAWDLTHAVARSLESTRPGTTERLDRLIVEEHAVEHGPVDLLRTFYAYECHGELRRGGHLALYRAYGPRSAAPSPTQATFPGHLAFYRAYQARSRFFLVVGAPDQPVALDLVLRIPDLAAPTSVAVFVNGAQGGSALAGKEWARTLVTVPASALLPGVNRIELVWPREIDDKGKLDELADTLEAGRIPNFSPIFGEVHCLTARVFVPAGG